MAFDNPKEVLDELISKNKLDGLDEVVVDITVIDSVQISLKSGDTYIDYINLYTRESFGGKEYPTTFTPTFEVLFNGKTNH